jgi:hypothetical protein
MGGLTYNPGNAACTGTCWITDVSKLYRISTPANYTSRRERSLRKLQSNDSSWQAMPRRERLVEFRQPFVESIECCALRRSAASANSISTFSCLISPRSLPKRLMYRLATATREKPAIR